MGAFSMIIVEIWKIRMSQNWKKKSKVLNDVKDVLWVDDVTDLSFPVEMFPDDIRDAFFRGDATMMVALFDNTTSADDTMQAITDIRRTTGDQCFASGMRGVVTDIKNLSLEEMPIYVVIAALLCLIILGVTMESILVPVLFLFSIGAAIIYNLGSNIFLGEISYITQALTAVLQLGVTMDYSIFLLNSYEENKLRFPGDKNRAMAHAISNTFKSVIGSLSQRLPDFCSLLHELYTWTPILESLCPRGL